MGATINGKILTANWGDPQTVKTYSGLYEQCHQQYDSQAWLCGRVTIEKDFTKGEKPNPQSPDKPIPKTAYVADKKATSFAISIDPHGKLGFAGNDFGGDHIIQVLTESVSADYLYYLQQKNISYIFAGELELNFTSAMQELATHFPIQTIMLEGGGHINGSFLQEGLIDELSVLLLPIADTTPNTPTLFELGATQQSRMASPFRLKEVKQLEHDVLWLKYLRR